MNIENKNKIIEGMKNTIKNQSEQIKKYEKVLKDIAEPDIHQWYKYKEIHGEEISFQEFLKDKAKSALKC